MRTYPDQGAAKEKLYKSENNLSFLESKSISSNCNNFSEIHYLKLRLLMYPLK